LFGGKRYQNFSVQQVSKTLAEVWLQGMLSTPEVASSHRATKSNNGNRNSRKQEPSNYVG
jgi:hypothetical protein